MTIIWIFKFVDLMFIAYSQKNIFIAIDFLFMAFSTYIVAEFYLGTIKLLRVMVIQFRDKLM